MLLSEPMNFTFKVKKHKTQTLTNIQLFISDKQNYRIDDGYTNDDNVSDIDEKFEEIYSSATKNDTDSRLPDGDSSFNLDNVEFADASDKEDLPDAMTAYEADRLLSSRFVNIVVSHCIFNFISLFVVESTIISLFVTISFGLVQVISINKFVEGNVQNMLC